MSNAKIVYASLTGNTEEIAYIVGKNLIQLGIDVTIEECSIAKADSFKEYDICIVATYTYGDGELPDEIVDFYNELKNVNLSKKVFGTCGSGDMSYENFCSSVDDFTTAFIKTGAIQGAKSIKVNLNADEEDKKNLGDFTKEIVSKMAILI